MFLKLAETHLTHHSRHKRWSKTLEIKFQVLWTPGKLQPMCTLGHFWGEKWTSMKYYGTEPNELAKTSHHGNNVCLVYRTRVQSLVIV
jgi:hypothetical protein